MHQKQIEVISSKFLQKYMNHRKSDCTFPQKLQSFCSISLCLYHCTLPTTNFARSTG